MTSATIPGLGSRSRGEGSRLLGLNLCLTCWGGGATLQIFVDRHVAIVRRLVIEITILVMAGRL